MGLRFTSPVEDALSEYQREAGEMRRSTDLLASLYKLVLRLQQQNVSEPYYWYAHPSMAAALGGIGGALTTASSRPSMLLGYPVIWDESMSPETMVLTEQPPSEEDRGRAACLVAPQYAEGAEHWLRPINPATGQYFVPATDPLDQMDAWELRAEVRRLQALLREAAITF